MTLKEDMKSRLATILSGMIADGGGRNDKPYLSALQVRTISSVILEHFFVLDRMELLEPQLSQETGRAARYLHALDHDLFPNVQHTESWELACEKMVAAIHDVEALELCLEWKENKDKEDKDLDNLAYKLYCLSNPLGHWAALDPSIKSDWVDIARNAKKLLA